MIHERKIAFISKAFQSAFKEDAQYVIVAPGRINMIGEHIDYNNYSVLPLCIDRTIELGISTGEKTGDFLTVANVESKEFPAKSFATVEDVHIDTQHSWVNYVLAAYTGVCEYLIGGKDMASIGKLFQSMPSSDWYKHVATVLPKHMKILVNGDLPKAGGLSSSSALVVSSFLAFLNVAGEEVSRIQLGTMCARAEAHVGTAGGGMDQAVISASKAGCAQHIFFNPLRLFPIYLPKDTALVVANSMIKEAKVEQAAKHYNLRVFECKVAAILLLKSIKGDDAAPLDIMDILHLQYAQDKCEMTIKEMVEAVEKYIKAEPYTKPEILSIIGTDRLEKLLSGRVGPEVWTANSVFYLYNRAKHVFTEALRVFEFTKICENTALPDSTKAKMLGELMNQSDLSCADLYDCGCTELSELTDLARKSGALGSRLTGAGWGGFTVSLIESSKANNLVLKIKAGYSQFQGLTDAELDVNLFTAQSADGISLYKKVDSQYEGIFIPN